MEGVPPPPSTASFQVAANYPHFSKLSWVWKYPLPHFPQLFFSSVVHGGGSLTLRVRAGTGTAAWGAMAAECASPLPEPQHLRVLGVSADTILPSHTTAVEWCQRVGSVSLLHSSLTGGPSGTLAPFSSPSPAILPGLYLLKDCVLSQCLSQA